MKKRGRIEFRHKNGEPFIWDDQFALKKEYRRPVVIRKQNPPKWLLDKFKEATHAQAV